MRRFMLAAALLGLTACSNPVPSFIVAPTVFWNQSTQLSGVAFTLQVQDNRASNGTLIMRDGDKVNAYPTTNNLPQQIQDTLTQAMTAQGARVTPGEPVIVTIQINQLEANANLKAVEHIVRNTVELTISIERESGSFNKPFSGRSTFSGPFKLDTAVAERELRVLTEQVLASLLRDQVGKNFAQLSMPIVGVNTLGDTCCAKQLSPET